MSTAYASYWSELIYLWMAEGEPQDTLYHLTYQVLDALNRGKTSPEILSIIFQMRFLSLAGFRPNFDHCHACKTCLDQIRHASVISDPSKGGIACPTCSGIADDWLTISKGTLKRLMWTDNGNLEKAARVRFTPTAITEGLAFLEAFVPFHIGRSPKSLNVLRTVRKTVGNRLSDVPPVKNGMVDLNRSRK